MIEGTVAIICASGGYTGALQAGALHPLTTFVSEHKTTITCMAGASVGNLNAGVLAQGHNNKEINAHAVDLLTIWNMIEDRGPKSVFPLKRRTVIKRVLEPSMLPSDPLQGLIDGTLLGVKPMDIERIVQSPHRFDVYLMDETRSKDVTVSNKDEWIISNPSLLAHAMVASASAKPFFPEIAVNGSTFSDSGLIKLGTALRHGCEFIFVLIPHFPQNTDSSKRRKWLAKTGIIRGLQQNSLRIELDTHKNLRSAIKEIRLRRASEILHAQQQEQETRIRRALEVLEASQHGKGEGLHRALEALCTPHGKPDNNLHRRARIFPIFLKGPTATLKTYTFDKGDISRALGAGKEQMEAILEKLERFFPT